MDMNSNYNIPPIPGTSGGANLSGGGAYAATPNPFFTSSNQFLPRNLHDVIRWARYITTQSPVTTEVIRKLSTYPITEFNTKSNSEVVKTKYREVYKSFKLKSALHDVGFDYYTVGNVFVSIYFPIFRSLTCAGCAAVFQAKKATFTTFKNYGFHGQCPKCGHSGEFLRKDTKSINIPDMNLIKWDPLNIVVNNNPVTGESEYFYKIPNEVKRKIQQGDKLFVNSVPWGLIDAVKNNQDFKFDDNHIYHLKNISAGHSINGIAVPPLISLYSLVYYQATLRKANESISTDFMNPLRVIYPMPQTGQSDPVSSISMRNFVGNMTAAMAQHRKDKNHVVFAPVPIGYQAVSGEGKALLVSQEIAQAEESILLSLGVSRELLSGVTNWQSSTVGLRLLQNTMDTYVGQINGLINWCMAHVSNYLNLESCEVELAPFKLTDDDLLRQALSQLVSAKEGSISTLYESYGMDYQEELKRAQQDAITKAVNEVETKFAVEQAVFNAGKNVVDKFDKDNSYRNSLAKANEIAQQLYQVDPMTRITMLSQLQVQDYAQYALVSRLLEQYDEMAVSAPMEEQGAEGGGGEGSGQAEGNEGSSPSSKKSDKPSNSEKKESK